MVSCKQVSCAEDAVQQRRTHGRRCYGPASDAEFLRSIADKTPGRDDDDGEAMRRRRQVYLKSYAFGTEGEGGGGTLLWRRKTRSSSFTSIANTSMWNVGKVMSQLLTRLASCACNPSRLQNQTD